MQSYLLKQAALVSDGRTIYADLLIKDGRIERIGGNIEPVGNMREINAEGRLVLPGVIDDQVHFREPGLTHKATIASESRAAVAGGVTSFMEMPNTIPNTLTQELLEDKYAIARNTSLANYSFFMGVSNDNAEEVLKTFDKREEVCGIKIFMGSSTGNMLVNNYLTLNKIFSESNMLIATHCEDERIIAQNLALVGEEELQAYHHPIIRNDEACFASSFAAIQLAKKHDSRLHILHISTQRELQLFTNLIPLEQKRITSEVCVHHLHFSADDYERLGYRIKCNPAIKASHNKEALWEALLDDRLDIIATDHAPHLISEKQPPYERAHAGLPLVQHSLLLMLHYVKQGKLSIEKLVEKMCHAPAQCFQLAERGYIREGFYADLVMVDINNAQTITPSSLHYKCGWSPLEGMEMPATVTHTWVNGHLAYHDQNFDETVMGQRLKFERA